MLNKWIRCLTILQKIFVKPPELAMTKIENKENLGGTGWKKVGEREREGMRKTENKKEIMNQGTDSGIRKTSVKTEE